MLILELL